VCENDKLNVTTGLVDSVILIRLLSGHGVPLFDFAEALNAVDHNSRPQVSYNPLNKYFLLVMALSEFPGAPFRDIFGILVDSSGNLSNLVAVPLVGFVANGTRTNLHSPQIIWAPKDLFYYLVFQIDLDGPQQFVTNIIVSPINPLDLFNAGFVVIGSALPRNRNAFMTFAPRTNDFLIVMDADTPGNATSSFIYGVVISAVTGNIRQTINYVNRGSQLDHHARAAYSTLEGQFLIVWNNGTEPEDNVTKRFVPESPESVSGNDWNINKVQSPSRSIETQKVNLGIKLKPNDQGPLSRKRQTPNSHTLKGTLLCANSSGITTAAASTAIPSTGTATTGFATTGIATGVISFPSVSPSVIVPTSAIVPPPNQGGSNKVALIASLVTIFGILAVVGVVALVIVCVILPRRRAARAKRFDPDHELRSN